MEETGEKEQIAAVARMQEYIGAHLGETVTPADLARAAMFSPWYAARLFARYTGLTPADYIRRLRLSRSALRLRKGGVKITDAALESGFNSVDGYQRAFLREFGCNPRSYAGNPVPIYLFTPYPVINRHAERRKSMDKVRTVYVSTIEKPERRVIIKRGIKAEHYFDYCEEVGCDIWGLLQSMAAPDGEPVCLWLPDKFVKPGTSKYVQGVEREADFAGDVPEGMEVITLPAATYLRFRGEPFAEEDYEEAIQAVWNAIEKYDPALDGLKWDDGSPRVQLEPVGTRGYIELMPVKKA